MPPTADALQVTGLPAVPLVGQVTVMTRPWAWTLNVRDWTLEARLASVAVTETVWLPELEYVVVKLAPDPDAGLPPGADQEKL